MVSGQTLRHFKTLLPLNDLPSKDVTSQQKNHAKDKGLRLDAYARRVKGHNRNALISKPERQRVHLLVS